MTMLPYRRMMLLSAILGVGGSLAASAGYALHLHGASYRRGIIEDVSAALRMNVELGTVSPLTLHSRRFTNVVVTLPDSGTEVFRCKEIDWKRTRNSELGTSSLNLRGGRLLVGTDEWRTYDYERMLQSSLGHDFSELGLDEVHFTDMDFEWIHDEFTLDVRQAVGDLDFDQAGEARATIYARQFNGTPLNRPVRLDAVVIPGRPVQLREVTLQVPSLPLIQMGLERVLQSSVTQGEFEGRLNYQENQGRRIIEAQGSLSNVSLSELSRRIVGGPFSGNADVTVDVLRLIDWRVDRLRFEGNLSGMRVTEVLPMFQAPSVPGVIDLRVHRADYAGNRIIYLSVSGSASEISLDALTQEFGYGRITGRLHASIRSLIVVDDEILSADIILRAIPPADAPGTIDRELVVNVAEHVLGIDLESFLPEQIEYARLGIRLVIDEGQLRIRGTHGVSGKTILTLHLFNRDWEILREPDRTFEVGDVMAELRARLESVEREDVRSWWERQHRGEDRRE